MFPFFFISSLNIFYHGEINTCVHTHKSTGWFLEDSIIAHTWISQFLTTGLFL